MNDDWIHPVAVVAVDVAVVLVAVAVQYCELEE